MKNSSAMKKNIPLLLLCAILSMACQNTNDRRSWFSEVATHDFGPIAKKTHSGNFSEIEISQAISAEFIKSEEEKIIISAPKEILDEILVEHSGDKVSVRYNAGIRPLSIGQVKAKVYTSDFEKISANSAANIILNDIYILERATINLSSGASFRGNVEANELSIDAASASIFKGKIWSNDLQIQASSGSTVSLSGIAKLADIAVSSASTLEGEKTTVRELKANSSSGSMLVIGVSEKLSANASSGAEIKIIKKGSRIAVQKDESSGGTISLE